MNRSANDTYMTNKLGGYTIFIIHITIMLFHLDLRIQYSVGSGDTQYILTLQTIPLRLVLDRSVHHVLYVSYNTCIQVNFISYLATFLQQRLLPYKFGESNMALKIEPMASLVGLLNPPPAAMITTKPRVTIIIIPPTIDTTITSRII